MSSLASSPPPSARAVALANMAWLLGDKALALVLGLAIHGMIARALGPEGAGHFAYASAMLQTGLGLSLVCAGVALLPRFCHMNAALPGAVANVFVLRMVASVLAMLAMMAYAVITVDDPQRRTVTLILLAAVPLIEPFYIVATYWLSRNHNRPTVIARSSGLLVRAAIVFTGLALGAPVWLLAMAWLAESIVNAALQTLQARHAFGARLQRSSVRLARMGAYLGFGLRFLVPLWLAQLFLRLDRLVLADQLDARAFGLYAAPMQLVEVWAQVAYLIGSSIATAYLYPRLRERDVARGFLGTAAAMAGVGLLGLLGAWLLGPWLLGLVFGAAFVSSAPFLVAGAAMAVLLFADQAVDMLLMGLNRPRTMVLKWAVAVLVAAAALHIGFGWLGALAGPAALACGLVAAWAVLGLAHAWRALRGGTTR